MDKAPCREPSAQHPHFRAATPKEGAEEGAAARSATAPACDRTRKRWTRIPGMDEAAAGDHVVPAIGHDPSCLLVAESVGISRRGPRWTAGFTDPPSSSLTHCRALVGTSRCLQLRAHGSLQATIALVHSRVPR